MSLEPPIGLFNPGRDHQVVMGRPGPGQYAYIAYRCNLKGAWFGGVLIEIINPGGPEAQYEFATLTCVILTRMDSEVVAIEFAEYQRLVDWERLMFAPAYKYKLTMLRLRLYNWYIHNGWEWDRPSDIKKMKEAASNFAHRHLQMAQRLYGHDYLWDPATNSYKVVRPEIEINELEHFDCDEEFEIDPKDRYFDVGNGSQNSRTSDPQETELQG